MSQNASIRPVSVGVNHIERSGGNVEKIRERRMVLWRRLQISAFEAGLPRVPLAGGAARRAVPVVYRAWQAFTTVLFVVSVLRFCCNVWVGRCKGCPIIRYNKSKYIMQKKHVLSIAPIVLAGGLLADAAQANSYGSAHKQPISVGAVAGTTGFGADVSWRVHPYLAVTARYTDGLSFDKDFNDSRADYNADFNMQASSLKVDLFPMKGNFFLSAGVMMPDIDADITGDANLSGSYTINGATFQADDLGSIVGHATIADSVQPYLGLGWRSSYDKGFGFFTELGVIATDIDVSLSTSAGYEDDIDAVREELNAEEKRLEDDIDKYPIYPVGVIGISYTF